MQGCDWSGWTWDCPPARPPALPQTAHRCLMHQLPSARGVCAHAPATACPWRVCAHAPATACPWHVCVCVCVCTCTSYCLSVACVCVHMHQLLPARGVCAHGHMCMHTTWISFTTRAHPCTLCPPPPPSTPLQDYEPPLPPLHSCTQSYCYCLRGQRCSCLPTLPTPTTAICPVLPCYCL